LTDRLIKGTQTGAVVPAPGPPFRDQVCETIADHPLDKGAAAGSGWIVVPKALVEIERSLLLEVIAIGGSEAVGTDQLDSFQTNRLPHAGIEPN
jgi:hypothetical protein